MGKRKLQPKIELYLSHWCEFVQKIQKEIIINGKTWKCSSINRDKNGCSGQSSTLCHVCDCVNEMPMPWVERWRKNRIWNGKGANEERKKSARNQFQFLLMDIAYSFLWHERAATTTKTTTTMLANQQQPPCVHKRWMYMNIYTYILCFCVANGYGSQLLCIVYWYITCTFYTHFDVYIGGFVIFFFHSFSTQSFCITANSCGFPSIFCSFAIVLYSVAAEDHLYTADHTTKQRTKLSA